MQQQIKQKRKREKAEPHLRLISGGNSERVFEVTIGLLCGVDKRLARAEQRVIQKWRQRRTDQLGGVQVRELADGAGHVLEKGHAVVVVGAAGGQAQVQQQ